MMIRDLYLSTGEGAVTSNYVDLKVRVGYKFNDWLQVFGRENGWIMIQYAIDKDHMRIGWIPESALPKDAYTETLWLEAIPARVTARSVVTDDPLFSCATLKTAEEGTEVTWLATMGDWAYVEIAGEQPARGFILLKNVQILEEADEKG